MPHWAIIMMVLAGTLVPFSFFLAPLIVGVASSDPANRPPAEVQYVLSDRKACERLTTHDSHGAIIGSAIWDSASDTCILDGFYRTYDHDSLVVGRGITLNLNYSGPFGQSVDRNGGGGNYVRVVNNGTIVIDPGRNVSFLGNLNDRGTISVENGATLVNQEGSIIHDDNHNDECGHIVVGDGGHFENKGIVETVKISRLDNHLLCIQFFH